MLRKIIFFLLLPGWLLAQNTANVNPRFDMADPIFVGVPWVDVRSFGAIADDGLDDSTSIQNAANFIADTLGKGVLYFPPGWYDCNQFGIGDSTKVFCDYPGSAWIRGDSLTAGRIRGTIYNLDKTNGNHYQMIQNIGIYKKNTALASCFNDFIHFYKGSHLVIDHVYCTRPDSGGHDGFPGGDLGGDKGITVEYTQHVKVTWCYLRNMQDNGIRVGTTNNDQGSMYAYVAFNTVELDTNWLCSGYITGGGYSDFFYNRFIVGGSSSGGQMFEQAANTHHVVYVGNTAVNSNLGLITWGGWNQIWSNNSGGTLGARAQTVASHDILFEGNHVTSIGGGGDTNGLWNFQVIGNFINGSVGHGIGIQTKVWNVLVEGNYITDPTNDGIYLGDVDTAHVSDNHIFDAGRRGMNYESVTHSMIVDNTVMRSTNDGVYTYNVDTTSFIDNTIMESGGYGYYWRRCSDVDWRDHTSRNNASGLYLFYSADWEQVPFNRIDVLSTGTPEAGMYGDKGSFWRRTDGSWLSTLYYKADGDSTVGWPAVWGAYDGKTAGEKTWVSTGTAADTVANTDGTASCLYDLRWTSTPGTPGAWYAEAKEDTVIFHTVANVTGTPTYEWTRIEK